MFAICSRRDKLTSVTPVSIFEKAGIEMPKRLAMSSWLQPCWCRRMRILLPIDLLVVFLFRSFIIMPNSLVGGQIPFQTTCQHVFMVKYGGILIYKAKYWA